MEKLIELLNEYDIGWSYDDYYWPFQYWQDRDAYIYGKYYLISKKYWFIKWLVDNDKIDIEKVIDTAKSFWIDTYYYEEGIDDIYIPLLMLLSIQDNPIEFLCSILK